MRLALDCGAGSGRAVRDGADMTYKPLLHSLQTTFELQEHCTNAEIGRNFSIWILFFPISSR